MKKEDSSTDVGVEKIYKTLEESDKKIVDDLVVSTTASRKKFMLIGLIVGAVLLIIGILVLSLTDLDIGFFVIVAAVIIMFGLISSATIKANKVIKGQVIPKVTTAVLGKDATYRPNNGFSRDFVSSLGVCATGNIHESTDQITGIFNNVPFTVVNEKDGDRHYSNTTKSTNEVIYFQGVIAIYKFNKQFKGRIEVREDENFNGGSNVFSKRDHIDFEDIEFNKYFNVYASDKEAAFYVITPQFIQAFKEIKRRIPGTLLFIIDKDRMVISVSGAHNSFEYDHRLKTGEELIKKLIKEIMPFIWFIDQFNLQDDFGKGAAKKAQKQIKVVENDIASQIESFAEEAADGDKVSDVIENGAEKLNSEGSSEKIEEALDEVTKK